MLDLWFIGQNTSDELDDVYFVRHVIYHEMSHLIHMNHSRAFYDVLKQFDPLLKKENEKLHKRC